MRCAYQRTETLWEGRFKLTLVDTENYLLTLYRYIDLNPVRVRMVEHSAVPFKFTDALDISSEGIVYFTDASAKYEQKEYLYDLLESKPHGRLLSYNLATGQTQLLLNDLYFANGVALSQQEDFVLVNETYRYRIIRY